MYMASSSPPSALLGALKKHLGVTKIAQKGCCFFAQISVFDQNSKEFFKNLKYILSYGPIFEKKCAKKGSKTGQNVVVVFLAFYPILPYLTLCLPYFPCFTLVWATSWSAAAKFGIKG